MHFPTRAMIGLALVSLASPLFGQDRLTPNQLKHFESKIRPVLVEHCYECHSAESDEPAGELLLDSRGGLRAGGASGPAVVPGRVDSSLLLLAIKQTDSSLVMPPEGYGDKLPDSVIADFEHWIRSGAADPRDEGQTPPSSATQEAQAWWAWKPVAEETAVPQVNDPAWPQSDIDRFVLAGLEQAGLNPSPPADRVTLVRRIAIDLTGLPPTKEELEEYALANELRPLDSLVEHYLQSSAYGERMGRHWLDVARYAESSGKDVNVSYPHAWRYRDYVIDAFNADLPFNQFIKEQIAGDLLPFHSITEADRLKVATGFLAIGAKSVNEMNPRQFAVDVADEQIDAVSQAFLAVTIACARCHDHKFDPVTQRDYSALAGVFLSTETHFGTTGGVGGRNRSDLVDLASRNTTGLPARSLTADEMERLKERQAELQEQQRALLIERRSGKSPDNTQVNQILRISQQRLRVEMQLESVDERGQAEMQAMAVRDKPAFTPRSRLQTLFSRAPGRGPYGRMAAQLTSIADSPQFIRGEIDKPGEIVSRGLPEFLAQDYAAAAIRRDQSGRLQLAEWIAGESNALTARVIVNRVWSWLMGEGIVSSLDNFGTSGALPSNQALLDHLSAEFVRQGWSIKTLVRQIVLSSSYQQSSGYRPEAFQLDPENRLCWRANRRALDAESLRDGVLYASGRLELERPVGSLIADAGDGVVGARRPGQGGISEDEINQADPNVRSVYLPIPRGVLPDALELFDFADNSAVSGKRDLTIVPSQALYWMNSSSLEKQCRAIAKQLLSETTDASTTATNPRAVGARLGYRYGPLASRDIRSGSQKLSRKQIGELFSDLSLRILSRPPLTSESSSVVDYVQERQRQGKSQTSIWAGVTRSLFASADYRFLR